MGIPARFLRLLEGNNFFEVCGQWAGPVCKRLPLSNRCGPVPRSALGGLTHHSSAEATESCGRGLEDPIF
ncbi:unnamed protein product [Protopolystoma xenopodis]|uniref:Uncharacterized protein n=1 Tax=Protopolystoma xenopodis TaxID=117903 RepID=A0A3S5CMT9_9PLAT|nr:unnamed protein product [Protopolystoma xenopodis]